MSKFECPIIEIDYRKIKKHENADTLSIIQVGAYPVIFKTSDFQAGYKAIYIPEDSLLPSRQEFAFVWRNKENPTEKQRVIHAIKLRGVFSCGIVIPCPDNLSSLPIGTDVSKELGIEKYEKPEEVTTDGDNSSCPSWFIEYTNIENIRKYPTVLKPDEEVIIMEKLHGSNSRFCYKNGKLWIGSHHNCKRKKVPLSKIAEVVLKGLVYLGLMDKGMIKIAQRINKSKKDMWSSVAAKLDLETKLSKYPGLIFFGEIFGAVQKGFDYRVLNNGVDFRVFDIYSTFNSNYLDYERVLEICEFVNLPMVPVIYKGMWKGLTEMEHLAEGKTVQGNEKHIREGVVIKPIKERWHDKGGRVIFKLLSKEYLVGKK